MDNTSSWNFTLANYGVVWSLVVQLGLLLIFLMLGNILRRKIPLFRNCLVPSALLGGTLLLVVDIIVSQFGVNMVDNRIMQVVTYHCLAIGFAAMTLKKEKSTHKTHKHQVVEFGASQGGTYMLQAFVGLGITIILFLITRYGDNVISYISGLILPLAYGQGPGNALSWDINFTNTAATQFAGNGSFGLSLASIGFVVASIVGVVYINIHKKKGTLKVREIKQSEIVDQTNPTGTEIPDNESIDKFTIQAGFVALAYAISFGFMCLLAVISDFTNSIAWGFNFLWASLAAMLIKSINKFLRKRKLMHRGYINNYQMDRISGFFFDSANDTSLATTSVVYLFLPLESSQLRVCSSPRTMMAEPLRKYLQMNSADCLQATMAMKSAFFSVSLLCLRSTASVNDVTATPFPVCLSSGSAVSLPIRMTLLSDAMFSNLLFLNRI